MTLPMDVDFILVVDDLDFAVQDDREFLVIGDIGITGPPGRSPNRSIYQEAEVAPVAGVLTIDLALAGTFIVDLDQDVTSVVLLSVPEAGINELAKIHFVNAGSFTVTGWPAGAKSPAGEAPTVSTGVGAISTIAVEAGGLGVLITPVAEDYQVI